MVKRTFFLFLFLFFFFDKPRCDNDIKPDRNSQHAALVQRKRQKVPSSWALRRSRRVSHESSLANSVLSQNEGRLATAPYLRLPKCDGSSTMASLPISCSYGRMIFLPCQPRPRACRQSTVYYIVCIVVNARIVREPQKTFAIISASTGHVLRGSPEHTYSFHHFDHEGPRVRTPKVRLASIAQLHP